MADFINGADEVQALLAHEGQEAAIRAQYLNNP